MKYSIMGFNQRKVVELSQEHNVKIDCNDLLILRWFANFRGTGKMKMKLIGETQYYWVDYKTIIDDLPILDIKGEMIRKRFQKYVKIGFFDRKQVNESQNGSKTFYTLNDLYFDLEYEAKMPPHGRENITPHGRENITPHGRENITPHLEENPSTNNTLTIIRNEEQNFGCEFFERFWSAFPKKVNMPGAIEEFEKLKVDEKLLNIMLSVIAREKKSETWQKEKGRFIPHPAKWLRERWWENQIEVITVNQYAGYGRELGGSNAKS